MKMADTSVARHHQSNCNMWRKDNHTGARTRLHPPQLNRTQRKSSGFCGKNWRTEGTNGPHRPSYLRLDSTGENSAGSSEDVSGGFSPEIQASPQKGHTYRSPVNFCDRQNPAKQPSNTESASGTGSLFERAKSAFGLVAPQYSAHHQRSFGRNLAHQTNPSEDRLASLDLVAEKFNMSCSMMAGNQHGRSPQRWHNLPAQGRASNCAPNHWGGHYSHPSERDQSPSTFFHPYLGRSQPSPPFIQHTQNYRKNFHHNQRWQQMTGANHQPFFHPPYHPHGQQGFNQFQQQPFMAWGQMQHHQLSPWQQWFVPQHPPLMQGFRNEEPSAWQHRARSPCKNQKQRWSHHGNKRHGNKNRTCHQSQPASCRELKQTVGCDKVDRSDPIKSPPTVAVGPAVNVGPVNDTDNCLHSANEPIPPKAGNDKSAIECNTSLTSEKVMNDVVDKCDNIQSEQIVEAACNTSDPDVILEEEIAASIPILQRHSSIDIILSDYQRSEVKSNCLDEAGVAAGSDFEDSASDDSAVDTQQDLWDSFLSSEDPYNPLCGWRCNNQDPPLSASSLQQFHQCRHRHVDSGTDEGDNWSETDSDDDYDSGDDSGDDEVDHCKPRCLDRSNSLQLALPQLQKLREDLSWTPCAKSGKSSPSHHPSVAFILGSTSSSSGDEDDDEDEDWDTIEDQSLSQDDPLWDSFNRAKDPYSPMDAWKCHQSSLASAAHHRPDPAQTSHDYQSTPKRTTINPRRDSFEKLRAEIQVASSSDDKQSNSPRICRQRSQDSVSDSDNFAIMAVRVHDGAKDDIDFPSRSAVVENTGMKRVASASCLRRAQLRPEIKATKKVRFCPTSSFIVLVEKAGDSSPCPAAETDWLACARDRMRFRARIDQAATALDPVLTAAHRGRVYQSRYCGDGCR